MSKTPRRDRIFISYRRADSAGQAGRLKDDLTRLLGDRVFMDVSDIAPGADFDGVLREQLASCGAVLAVIGAHWSEALAAPREGLDYVRLELAQALAQEEVRVVPVLVQGASLPGADSLPDELRSLERRQATVVRDDRWKDDVAHLARELRLELGLRRVSKGWVAAGVFAICALLAWVGLSRPAAPGPYARSRAQEIALAATQKAAAACKPSTPSAPLAGSCPLVFEFAPDGSTRKVYFDSGSCLLKAPPFGACVLTRLGKVRIRPFDDLTEADVGLSLTVGAGRTIKVGVDE